MKKLESTFVNMFVVLSLIALLSAALLSFTYSKTSVVRAEVEREQQQRALAAVLPEFDNSPGEEAFVREGYELQELYPARRNGEQVGIAVRSVTRRAYSGTMVLLVGFDAQGVITGIQVLNHTETPGLGSRVTEDEFLGQFIGQDLNEFNPALRADGGEVDVISAATITSNAAIHAIQTAFEAAFDGEEE